MKSYGKLGQSSSTLQKLILPEQRASEEQPLDDKVTKGPIVKYQL